MIPRSIRLVAVLLAAAGAGMVSARLMQPFAHTLPGPVSRVRSITPSSSGFEVVLGSGRRYRVDTLRDSLNARNIVLLHPGKNVTLSVTVTDPGRAADAPCVWIIPLLEQSPDGRTEERYRQLRHVSTAPGSAAREDLQYTQRSLCAARL